MRTLKFTAVVTVLVGLVVLYAVWTGGQNKEASKGKGTTSEEVNKIISKDLTVSYPVTPREVVKLYSRIITCYYNDSYTEDELHQLSQQARKLMDKELLDNNEYNEFFEDLTTEIAEYGDKERTISTYLVDKNSQVVYQTVDGQEYATLGCVYYLSSKEGSTKTSEKYTLRKDENGYWKILFWKLGSSNDGGDE